MKASTIVFYLLAALTVALAIRTVNSRSIFRSAVWLLLTLLCIAGIYILLEMEFIAAIQIIIYVGGIVVLIIFSIFLTHRAGENLPAQKPKRVISGLLMVLAGFTISIWALYQQVFKPDLEAPVDDSVKNIGRQLLDFNHHGYVFPFEIVSILLLAALIGSIVIAMRDRGGPQATLREDVK